MARKKQAAEHENHERWLVSYADFITLLFAFFVVMYSVSSVNEGKFRVLSDSLSASFRSPNKSLNPIQIGSLTRSPRQFSAITQSIPFQTTISPIQLDKLESMSDTAIDISEPLAPTKPQDDIAESINAVDSGDSFGEMGNIADNLEEVLDSLIDKDMVKLRKTKNWVEIEINNNVLFTSGSSQLAPEARPVLQSVADVLKALPNRINVEGFTDNLPIKNLIYPSNWELSASRAATVVRLFASYGVEPSQLVSIGYGEFQPIADNSTPIGRARNRRITVKVLSTDSAENGQKNATLDQANHTRDTNTQLVDSTKRSIGSQQYVLVDGGKR